MKETVLIIREFDKFSQTLADNDFQIINLPLINTLPVENFDELDAKLANLESYNGLFLTSPNAAGILLKRFREKNFTFAGQIYVLGNRVRKLFENTHFEIVFKKDANTATEFIDSFDEKEFAGKKFLFVRGDKSLRQIPELLKNKAEIDEIIAYRTIEKVIDENIFVEINEKFHQRKIDFVCFFSPSGIESFVRTFGKEVLNDAEIAVIGPTTADKATKENLKVAFMAAKSDAENFATGLIKYLRNRKCRLADNG